jgi:hypothetical protein
MNHQERMELLGALSRAGVNFYKSQDLEVHFERPKLQSEKSGLEAWLPEKSAEVPAVPIVQNDDATEKLKDLINTMKLDDASLLDKIFPAGAGL